MTPRLLVETVAGEHDLSQLRPAEIDALLEIGYLTVACDRELSKEEIESFEHFSRSISPPGSLAKAAAFHESAERFASYLERDGLDGRLDICAAALSSRLARTVAYKLACALALADQRIDDREFELDLSLIAALGLTQDEADALADEIHRALRVD